jgi:mRNA interferase YafQ
MLIVEYTTQFKRDLKKAKKRKKNLTILQKVMNLIADEKPLPAKFKNHNLAGTWKHHKELHLEPDWLLIYKIVAQNNIVIFVRTGTHSELFE